MSKPTYQFTVRIYLRVSTSKQAESGLGLEAQEFNCRAFAKLEFPGMPIQVYTEKAVHGDDEVEDRPELTKLMSDLRRGDVLLVAKCDRLAREQLIQLLLEREIVRKKCRFLSAAGEGTGAGNKKTQLTLRTITTLQSELERLDISDRTKNAMQSLKRQKLQAGQIPYGFTRGELRERVTPRGERKRNYELTPNPAEQEVISLVADLRQQGISIGKIAIELNQRNIPTRTRDKMINRGTNRGGYTPGKGQWTKTQVFRVLSNLQSTEQSITNNSTENASILNV
jgi:site-specific DNA recombinase